MMCKTFEGCFLRKAFFLGEHSLDSSLMDLNRCLSDLSSFELTQGVTMLVNMKSLDKKIHDMGPGLRKKWRTEKQEKDFNLFQFCSNHNISLDSLGLFPLVFQQERKVRHALRLAWAFYLTIRMKNISFQVRQRCRKQRFKTNQKNLLSCLFIHYFQSLQGDQEEKWIKQIKNSLCRRLSLALQQTELPEGDFFSIVPSTLSLEIPSETAEIDFFFSLLQSKVLCQQVPESFVKEALKDHARQLGSPHRGISEETCRKLYEKGVEFGKRVSKYYNFSKTVQPSTKATFSFSRNRGGIKGELSYKGLLKSPFFPEDSELERMEPLVIGLFGLPGSGKSSFIPHILSELKGLFPGIPDSKLTYSRTCNVEHWDGYDNQPIVILDDLGQSMSGSDIQEFQTLVSCNPYVLPMAELSEKGKKFTSQVIICTSNLRYGASLKNLYPETSRILDDCSFWRRFHFPVLVEDGQSYVLRDTPNWVNPSQMIFPPSSKVTERKDSRNRHLNFYPNLPDLNHLGMDIRWTPLKEFHLQELFKDRQLFFENIRSNWNQRIIQNFESTEDFIAPIVQEYPDLKPFLKEIGHSEGNSLSIGVTYSSFPPSDPLPVRVEPILEPLKVRTITAGSGEVFCLKPFQMAMWRALGDYPQFCLTHGTKNLFSAISRIYEASDSTDVWISGDYSAATDSFPIEASKALLEGILTQIPHEPTKRWAMKEISPHLLVYPKWTGLEPVLQKSGQLMGSLLSFPLLCLLNDMTAESIGLTSNQYLINGDDILMRCPRSLYPEWKEKVQEFGLTLSLGKNYIHEDYGTVNSQLIFRSEVLSSGKQKLIDRHSEVLGECLRDLDIVMSETSAPDVHKFFKEINREKLSRTVRSISVPVSHGGLAFRWGDRKRDKRSILTDHYVYLHDLFQKLKPEKGCLCLPVLSSEQSRAFSVSQTEQMFMMDSNEEAFQEKLMKLSPDDVIQIQKRVKGNPFLREIVMNRSLESFPSLTFIKAVQIPFSDDNIREKLQRSIDKSFFAKFIDIDTSWGYDDFKKSFLYNIGLEKGVESRPLELLINLMDVELRPHWITYIRPPERKIILTSERIKKRLGSCDPRHFNLPQENSVDFSREVEKTMDRLLKGLDLTEEDFPFYGQEPELDLCFEILSQFKVESDSDSISLDPLLEDPMDVETLSV